MKKLYLVLLFAAISLQAADVPDFRIKNLNNQIVAYSALKGEQLTLIDFWATWCKPCIQSIPKLNSLYQTYKERSAEWNYLALMWTVRVTAPR